MAFCDWLGHDLDRGGVQRVMREDLEELVARATDGDGAALDAVLRAIKDDVYGLALRMLWHPADAEDATQETLLRVVTQLSKFEGRSRFRTWVYRVAVRSILNFKRSRGEHGMSFDEYGDDLLDGLNAPTPGLSGAERDTLREEVKVACTLAMLQCLDRDHRIAYVLGEIFDLKSDEAAEILDVSPETHRQRLSRARKRVYAFTASRCSLVQPSAPCSCEGRIGRAIELGRVDPKNLLFNTLPLASAQPAEAAQVAELITAACDAATLMRSNPRHAAPDRLLDPLVLLRRD